MTENFSDGVPTAGELGVAWAELKHTLEVNQLDSLLAGVWAKQKDLNS